MTAQLTDDARTHLERYLRQVSATLRGHSGVEATDIERDVRGHIDAALAGQPEPIDTRTLLPILERLGAPGSWIPEDELSVGRRLLNRLRSGPEEWRLAYLSLALFFTGTALFLSGPWLWPLEPLMAVASVLMARAALALLAEHDEPVSARRWLLHPPLVVAYLPLVVAFLAWPAPLAVAAADTVPVIRDVMAQVNVPFPPAALVAAAALGLWWTVLGLVLMVWTRLIGIVFYPFGGWFTRRHAGRLAMAGVLVMGVAALLIASLGSR